MQHRPVDLEPPPPGELVELRVHGVGGTSPEDLLATPVTQRVAGDPEAGFFRPWLDQGRSPALEGYSWGGLTSASSLRALWVLLTPFALVNLAGWMVRHGGAPVRGRRARRGLESTAAGLIRLFGLAVTVAAVGYAAAGGIDLAAYQCGTRPSCIGGRWWLAPWESGLVSGHLGRVLTVGALVPLVGILGLAWLARRSQMAIHPGLGGSTSFSGRDDPAFLVNLFDQRLWDSPHVAHRLGLTHTAAALGAVGATLATVVDQAGVAPVGPLVFVGWVVMGLAAAATVYLNGIPPWVHVGLLGTAVGHLLSVGVVAWTAADPAPVAPGPAPGAQVVADVLLVMFPALAALSAIAVLVLWSRHRDSPLRVALMVPSLLLAASGLVSAFGSGLLIRLADILGRAVVHAEWVGGVLATQTPIVYSDAVADAAVVTVVAMAVLVLAVVVVWLGAEEGPDCEALSRRYADRGGLNCSDPDDQAWGRTVSRAESIASLTDQAANVVAAVVGLVLLATTLAVLTTADPVGMRLGPVAERLSRPAALLLGLVPLGAVYGIMRAYRSQPARRVVGVLWDVATFWPRWFHPWSPPSYGERAVPQLRHRLEVLSDAGKVVLSGHSQGSVLAVATLATMSGATPGRLALLTHGSPLSRLYCRYFPEYIDTGLCSTLAGSVAGWINLWRPTDFIGGPLAAAGIVDVEVVDPPSSRPPSLGEARPVPLGHSHYYRTEEYGAALTELVERLG